MWSNLTLLVGLFIALLSVGSCQPTSSKDYKYLNKCGINLVLENTIRRRLGEIPYSAETQNGEPPKKRTNYTSAELHPWVVSYGSEDKNGNWNHVCGGSIISTNFVLTAHHCYKNIGKKGKIRAGDSDLTTTDGDKDIQVVTVIDAKLHPFRNAKSDSAFFDLVVLRVDPPFKFTNSVRHICLPKEALKKADDRDGEGVTVAGYGETAVGKLQSTMVTIRPESFCKRIYESKGVKSAREKQSGEIPTKTEDENATEVKNDSKVQPLVSVGATQTETRILLDAPVFIRARRDAEREPTSSAVKRFEVAAKLVPTAFNTSIMCIGSEIGGIGACKGDDGGPGYIFDTGNGINEEKFVQIAVFSGSVECGLASFPDIYVRLEEKETLDFVREFAPSGKEDRVASQKENDVNGAFETSF